MGFDPESVKLESLGLEKSKGMVKEEKDGETVDVGCWVGFRFMEKGCSCMRFRSKVSRYRTSASYEGESEVDDVGEEEEYDVEESDEE